MRLIFFEILIFFSLVCFSQDRQLAENYIIKLRSEHQKILAEYLNYTTNIVHSKSNTDFLTERDNLIAAIGNAISNVTQIPCFNEDCMLSDSLMAYFRIVYKALKNDTVQKPGFGDINELTFNELEKFLATGEIAGVQMNHAAANLELTQKHFAQKYGVDLSAEIDPLTSKIELVNQINDYYNKIFLIFFKSYEIENNMSEALDSRNCELGEELRTMLIKVSSEGLIKLNEIVPFRSDSSLHEVVKDMLSFYISEAQLKIPVIIEYLIKRELHESGYTNFDTSAFSSDTTARLTEYNRLTKELNKTHKNVLYVQHELLQQRKSLIENWNKASKGFLEKHIPRV